MENNLFVLIKRKLCLERRWKWWHRLHPNFEGQFEDWRDATFAAFEGRGNIFKWDVLAFGTSSGCGTRCFTLTSRFVPPKARHSDSLSHMMSPFFGRAKNLGICEAAKDSSSASSKKREKKAAFVSCIWRSLRFGTIALRCGVIGLQMWPSKDVDPELGHSHRHAIGISK